MAHAGEGGAYGVSVSFVGVVMSSHIWSWPHGDLLKVHVCVPELLCCTDLPGLAGIVPSMAFLLRCVTCQILKPPTSGRRRGKASCSVPIPGCTSGLQKHKPSNMALAKGLLLRSSASLGNTCLPPPTQAAEPLLSYPLPLFHGQQVC